MCALTCMATSGSIWQLTCDARYSGYFGSKHGVNLAVSSQIGLPYLLECLDDTTPAGGTVTFYVFRLMLFFFLSVATVGVHRVEF